MKRVQCTCIQRRGVALNLKKEHSDRAARLRTGTLKKRMPTRPPLRKYRSCSKQLNRHNVSTPVSWVSAHFLFAREPYFTKKIFFSPVHIQSFRRCWVGFEVRFNFYFLAWNCEMQQTHPSALPSRKFCSTFFRLYFRELQNLFHGPFEVCEKKRMNTSKL